jgi:hypothetical protein
MICFTSVNFSEMTFFWHFQAVKSVLESGCQNLVRNKSKHLNTTTIGAGDSTRSTGAWIRYDAV